MDNLEWCTHKYNNNYREEYGTACNRPVIAVNLETFEVFHFESRREAGRQLGVNAGHISSVVRGKRYTSGGYWFCNADENAVEKVRGKFGDKVANKVKKLIGDNL